MPGHRTTLRLQPTRQAPRLARRAVRDASVDLPPETRHAALTVVSELVTNAVVHGTGVITVAIERRAGAVAIAVSDEGPHGLMMLTHATDADSGRGLTVVESLASAWGVRPSTDGPGKVVWARIGAIPSLPTARPDAEPLVADGAHFGT